MCNVPRSLRGEGGASVVGHFPNICEIVLHVLLLTAEDLAIAIP